MFQAFASISGDRPSGDRDMAGAQLAGRRPRAWVTAWLAALGLVLGLSGHPALAFQAPVGMGTVQRSELPPQGRDVLAKIESGAAFRHEKDGSVFGNRERRLPRQTRGYYREYTVRTPGVKHRGARRIVCGGEVTHRPDACYYTEDHYDSFRLIVQ